MNLDKSKSVTDLLVILELVGLSAEQLRDPDIQESRAWKLFEARVFASAAEARLFIKLFCDHLSGAPLMPALHTWLENAQSMVAAMLESENDRAAAMQLQATHKALLQEIERAEFECSDWRRILDTDRANLPTFATLCYEHGPDFPGGRDQALWNYSGRLVKTEASIRMVETQLLPWSEKRLAEAKAKLAAFEETHGRPVAWDGAQGPKEGDTSPEHTRPAPATAIEAAQALDKKTEFIDICRR